MSQRRNIGIIAHIDAGKTTISERFLYYSGREYRLGEVHDGTAVMDWQEEEQERGITITSAATSFDWRDHRINLIDTPGHVDFTAEVERSLRVLDGAVGVFCGVAGVQAQSETVWRQADRYGVPRLVFVNKLDRVGADFLRVVGDVAEKLGCRTLPLVLPLGLEGGFRGVIDLVTQEELTFDEKEDGSVVTVSALSEENREFTEMARSELLEAVAEGDDDVMALYLEGDDVPVDLLRAAIRRGTLSRRWVPVLGGSAFRNRGVQPLLDAVVHYLPSPEETPPVVGLDPKTQKEKNRRLSADEPLAALIFKVYADQHSELCYSRIYSGRMKKGQSCLNPRTGKKERFGLIYHMHANKRESVEEAVAGDIVAVVGLRFSGTGDTLCDPKSPILLEPPVFPDSVISMAIEPKSAADRDRLEELLTRMTREDPTFHFEVHPETGQFIMAGMGELHLEVIRHRLIRDFKLAANVGNPRVSYRQTFQRDGRKRVRFEREVAGKEHLGVVELHVERDDDLVGTELHWEDAGELPLAWRAKVEESVQGALAAGGDLALPFIRLRVGISIPEFTPQVTEVGLAMAVREAFDRLEEELGTLLLEPVMRFQIETPEEYFGGINQDLVKRRAQIDGVAIHDELRRLNGRVPLSEVFGYTTTLRSISQGRASMTLEPIGFDVAPDKVAAKFRF